MKEFFPLKQRFVIKSGDMLKYKIALSILAIAACFALTSFQEKDATTGPADEIQWVTLDEAQELNKKEPRKIFIDIYTTWCGPCKMMDKKTFANPEVVNYVNEHYYAVKLNGEGKEKVSIFGDTFTEAELAYSFRVQGYPSLVFINEKLQPYEPVAGYIPAKHFIQMLKQFKESS